MSKAVLTIDEFSEMFALNKNTVSTMVTRNPSALPSVLRIGRQIRFPIAAVEAWQQGQIEGGSKDEK